MSKEAVLWTLSYQRLLDLITISEFACFSFLMKHEDRNDCTKDQIPPALLNINLKAASSSGNGFFPELIAEYLVDNCQDLWKVLLSMSNETTDIETKNEDVWIKGFHANFLI